MPPAATRIRKRGGDSPAEATMLGNLKRIHTQVKQRNPVLDNTPLSLYFTAQYYILRSWEIVDYWKYLHICVVYDAKLSRKLANCFCLVFFQIGTRFNIGQEEVWDLRLPTSFPGFSTEKLGLDMAEDRWLVTAKSSGKPHRSENASHGQMWNSKDAWHHSVIGSSAVPQLKSPTSQRAGSISIKKLPKTFSGQSSSNASTSFVFLTLSWISHQLFSVFCIEEVYLAAAQNRSSLCRFTAVYTRKVDRERLWKRFERSSRIW